MPGTGTTDAPARGRTGGRRWLRWALAALALACAMAIVAGFFGDHVAAFDSVGHFRAHLSVAALLAGSAALIVGPAIPRLAGAAALAAALAGFVTVAPYVLPDSTPMAADSVESRPAYRLLQMNLRYDVAEPAEAIRRIAAEAPDVVTLQETGRDWQARLETLSATYPHQFYCSGPFAQGNVAILSKRPFLDETGYCDVENGFAARRIDFNGTVATIVSQHLQWPWPFGHWRQLDELQETLGLLRGPVLIAGDFNATPWSAALATYAAASGTTPMTGIGFTWLLRALPGTLAPYIGLPIDHVLATPGIVIRRLGTLAPTASDHLPIAATFSLPAPPPAAPDTPLAAAL